MTDRGTRLPWDAVVLATGAKPRRLPFAAPRGVHVLRTLGDALALQAELELRPAARRRRRRLRRGGGRLDRARSRPRGDDARGGRDAVRRPCWARPSARYWRSGTAVTASTCVRSAGGRLPCGRVGTSLRDRARRTVRRSRATSCSSPSASSRSASLALPHPIPGSRRCSGRARPLDERRGRRCSCRSPDSRPRPASGRGRRSSGRTSSGCGSSSSATRAPRPRSRSTVTIGVRGALPSTDGRARGGARREPPARGRGAPC